MPINIVLTKDQPVLNDGIKSILENYANLKLTGVYDAKEELLKEIQDNNPDIVLFDLTYCKEECLESIKHISNSSYSVKIIVLTNYLAKDAIKVLLDIGVKGVLLKDNVAEILVQSIYKVMSGEVCIPPSAGHKYSNDDTRKAMEDFDLQPVLHTKLHPPKVYHDQIIRSAIVKQLENNLEKPISLISAPAGYGKSQTISQWINQTSAKSCWIALDDEHNNLRVFLTYLVSAITEMIPGIIEQTTQLLSANELPPINTISYTLINELDQIDENFILVLDDYHRIKEKDIHLLLDLILTYPPQKMHISILSRRDPPLKLNSLLVNGRMIEVRMRDLAFSETEIVALFEKLLNIKLNKGTTKSLKNKTEGWIVALRMASLLIRDNDDADDILTNIHGDIYSLTKYLLEEVLMKQPMEYQGLLLKVSVLDRFSADLIDRLTIDNQNNSVNGKEFINWLLHSNLFVISLDPEDNWYRLHHLIQDFLLSIFKKKYSTEYIHEIHTAASNWFYSKDLFEEAIQHAIKTDKPDLAIQIIENQRHELMSKEEFNRLESLAKLIPEEWIEKHCGMLICMSFIKERRGQLSEMLAYANKALKLLDNSPEKIANREIYASEIAVINGALHVMEGEIDNVIEVASKALKKLPAHAYHQRSYAVGEIVLTYQMKGRIDKGVQFIEDIDKSSTKLKPISQARMQLWFCMAYWMEGNIDALKISAKKCLSLGLEYNLSDSAIYGKYFLACGHYIQNEIMEAKQLLLSIINDAYSIRPSYLANSSYLLTSIYLREGNKQEAIKIAEKHVSIAIQKNDIPSLTIASTYLNELSLELQDEAMMRIVKGHLDYNTIPKIWFYYIPQLAPIKQFLAKNTVESLNEAELEIVQLDKQIKEFNRNTIRVELMILYALVLQARNRKAAALDKLSEALRLSAKGKFIRTYLDYGNPVKTLLDNFLPNHPRRFYIDQILNAFKIEKGYQSKDSNEELSASLSRPTDKLPLLSIREMEILKYLASGFRNKEIADRLFISEGTVKKHVYNIGQKWDLHNRINIIHKARELNYI